MSDSEYGGSSCSCSSSFDDCFKIPELFEIQTRDDSLNIQGYSSAGETEQKPERKKHINRWKTICTVGCRYDIVHDVARQMGLKEVSLEDPWIIHWTDLSVSFDRILEMKRYQKINHFPGMSEICRKDLLARNMNRMFKMFPIEYSIFPLTWCLPADYADLNHYVGGKRRTMICKPDAGCQGKGIFLVRAVKEISSTEKQIVQQYITKPFLIDGYKFDLRVYVLITAVEPEFRLYVYNEGLARFATIKYERPSSRNLENMFMHLTNYAVNRHSSHYIQDDEAGSKRKLSAVNKWWDEHDYDTKEIWSRIDDAIVKTFISASGTLRHNYRSCFPNHTGMNACFEILGFDVLLDHNLNPFILEVNLNPSFHTDTNLDREVKESLIHNTLDLVDWDSCNPKRCVEEERKRARNRLFHYVTDRADISKRKSVHDDFEEILSSREMFELEHMGNFRLIYPTVGCKEKYDKYFDIGVSYHQETIASRAREECSKLLREELVRDVKPDWRTNKDSARTSLVLSANKSVLNPPRALPSKVKLRGNNPSKLPSATQSTSTDISGFLKQRRKICVGTVTMSSNSENNTVLKDFDWPYDFSGKPVCVNNPRNVWKSKIKSSFAEINRLHSMKQRSALIRSFGIANAVKKALCQYKMVDSLPWTKGVTISYESPYKAKAMNRYGRRKFKTPMTQISLEQNKDWNPVELSKKFSYMEPNGVANSINKESVGTKYYWLAKSHCLAGNSTPPIRLTRAHVIRTQSNVAKMKRLEASEVAAVDQILTG